MRQYSRALDQYYTYNSDEGILTFEDGVRYTVKEACIVARGDPTRETVMKIHLVKQVFEGTVTAFSLSDRSRKQ